MVTFLWNDTLLHVLIDALDLQKVLIPQLSTSTKNIGWVVSSPPATSEDDMRGLVTLLLFEAQNCCKMKDTLDK